MNLGLNSQNNPNISCTMTNCPSTRGPAPIPYTGIFSSLATISDTSSGTASMSKSDAPDSSIFLACSRSFFALSFVLAVLYTHPFLHVFVELNLNVPLQLYLI